MTNKLTRREFLKASVGALVGATLPPQLLELSAAPRPNIVFIFADQLRACSISPYGNSQVDTPNLAGLAADGALFPNAVSTSPLCAPTRACIMTGRYPNKTGVIINNIKLSSAETCIAEVFRANGYMTGYIGKWNLNGHTPDPILDPGWVAPKDRQGFRRWTAYNEGHIYYGSQYYKDNDPTLRRLPLSQYEPDFQTDEAINFITSHKNKPFCLFVSIGIPHQQTFRRDLPPGGDYTFPYDPDTMTLRPNVDYPDLNKARKEYADYYGMVSNIDWNVGRILSTLDSLNLSNKTIVVVTSDHGDYLYSHYGYLGVERGKQVIYAESLDVPFILRLPRYIRPQVVNDVFSSVDIMPTLLGMCGLPLPAQVMGRDFTPLLASGDPPLDPPYGPVPSTESALVAMLGGEYIWVGVRTRQYSLECDRLTYQPTKLFDNLADPYQLTNVVDDPLYATIKEELHQQLLAWVNYVGM